MDAKLHTLKNGLRVLLIDTKAFPSVTTILLVGAGSRYENAKNNGIAHFFEHMAFKGSKKYPTSMILASTIEGFGGVFNAFTGKDHTGYWIKAPTEHFETMTDVLADMIQHSLLDREEIEREKGVIVEEINLYEDTPYKRVGELYESLVYRGSPLEFQISGTKDTVTKFTKATFVDYMNKLYDPGNAVFVVAGGLNKMKNETESDSVNKGKMKNYLDLIGEKFGDWKNGRKGSFKKVTERQKKPGIIVKYKKTEQAHFCVGFRAYSQADRRKYTLSVLATILGGGMSSRLFYEVRERRGLAYYISTTRDLYQDVGNLVTQAGVPTSVDKIKLAVEVALKEHEKVKRGEVTVDELERARELIKGRLILSFEDSSSVATFFGKKLLLEGKTQTLKDILAQVDRVSRDDIVEVASDIFTPSKLNFALIGPFKDKTQFADVVTI